MTFVLLQDPVATGFLEQILKQGLPTGLMAVAVVFLWKRQEKSDAKLEKYIEEDRKDLMQTIANNTEAFKKNNEILEKVIQKMQ